MTDETRELTEFGDEMNDHFLDGAARGREPHGSLTQKSLTGRRR